MTLQTPLGRVRRSGSAGEGTGHWWHQTLTSIALIPLGTWFIASLAGLAGADYATTNAWLRSPLVAIVMLLFLGTCFYHMKLGLQVVIEDYVHNPVLKLTAQIMVVFASIGLAATCLFAVLKIAFGF